MIITKLLKTTYLTLGIFSQLFLPTSGLQVSVDTTTNRLINQQGHELTFHGTNIVYKLAPYIPETEPFNAATSLTDTELDQLATMGYNSIRLGVLWAAYEPVQGQYNTTYFTQLDQIINRAGQRGIYTVLDAHQDVYNRRYCGDGFPDWTIDSDNVTFPEPVYPSYPQDGAYPNRTTCESNRWPKYYFSQAVNRAFQRLYTEEEVRGGFIRFWGKIAETWKGSPYVIGYELINEPWCGNIYHNPTLLVPGVADRKYLQPLYQDIHQAIRRYDTTTLILFQSVTWELVGIGETFGFTQVPGGTDYRNRTVLAIHDSIDGSIASDTKYYDLRKREIERLGCGVWITETDYGKLSTIDRYGWSWFHWDMKYFSSWTWDKPGIYKVYPGDIPCNLSFTECLDANQVRLYSRTYPTKVVGRQLHFRYNETNGDFTFNYLSKPSQSSNQPATQIFLSPQWNYQLDKFIANSKTTSLLLQKQVLEIRDTGSVSNNLTIYYLG